jgi:ATP-dependent DNA helicase RecG
VERARRPLLFALKDDGRNLAVVRGLSNVVGDVLLRLAAAGVDAALLAPLRQHAPTLDQGALDARLQRAREVLGALERVGGGGGAPAVASASATPLVRPAPVARTPVPPAPASPTPIAPTRAAPAPRTSSRAPAPPPTQLALADAPPAAPAKRTRKPRAPKAEAEAAPTPALEVDAKPAPASKGATKGASKRAAARRAIADDDAAGLGLLPLDAVAGVGKETARKLMAAGLETVLDALLHLPRGYEDRRVVTPIVALSPGVFARVEGEVLHAQLGRGAKGRPTFEAVIGDGSATVSLRWFRFHADGMKKRFVRGRRVAVSGTPTFWGAMRQMVHPEVEAIDDGAEAQGVGITPIYPEIADVRPRTLRTVLQNLASRFAHRLEDPLPLALRRARGLPSRADAVRKAHLPETLEPGEDPDAAVRARLVYDELFFLQLVLAGRRRQTARERGLVQTPDVPWPTLAAKMLPFTPTRAQARVIEEIARDLAKPEPMSRLLQGDVGSGKTAVALVAAAIVARAGRQTALLAPTEILAEQHARTAADWWPKLGLEATLLTGSTRAAVRRERLARLRAGDVTLIVGTHAILEDDIVFADLGLVIVDEQHRFGVAQRAKLRAKARGLAPDVLVMSATPIPRTLALTVYGDLDVSIIDERPPGRTPIQTKILADKDRGRAYRTIEAAIAEGRQAYVVFPLVEASEQLDMKAATDAVDEIRARFPGREVGLLHGRMRPEEKDAVMARFRGGEAPVLVSTTVIEVGVDVPNATVMVIENAERFGLSQLHQLRGRVGRGRHAGTCLLVVGGGGREAWEKLAVLERTDDGFKVAEADLAIRGPGEILGTRQSGVAGLAMADLVRDAAVLEDARADAEALLERDPTLADPAHAAIAREAARRERLSLGLVDVG